MLGLHILTNVHLTRLESRQVNMGYMGRHAGHDVRK